MEARTYHTEVSEKLKKAHAKVMSSISLFSWLRLLSFLLFVALLFFYTVVAHLLVLVIALLSFAGLIGFVLYHQRLYQKGEYLYASIEVVDNEINVINQKPSIFDDGNTFAANLPFADDLDLFGRQSLFHYLNRCQTRHGKDLLANALLQHVPEKQQILLVQEAVKEFTGLQDFKRKVMVGLLLAARDKHAKSFEPDDISRKYLFDNNVYKVSAWLLPLLTAASLLFGILTGNYLLLVLNGSFSMFMAFRQSRKMMLLADEIAGRNEALKAHADVFEAFNELQMNGTLLKTMQQETAEAFRQIRRLSKLSERFDWRNNMLLYALGNFFFLYDIRLALAYESWKRENLNSAGRWAETLGRIEFLISLGNYAFNNSEAVFPLPVDEDVLIAKNIGHPLISKQQLVRNDVELRLDPRIMLVTGSNMSGKSTFLRTLGVNVLLAQAGAPVFASYFEWKPMQVLSSLRQSDSLQENTSLFMNELKRLKYILDEIGSSGLCLVLLDEILRGTNSEDKYHGSHQLIMKLMQMNCLVVMATHDLKLSKLEESQAEKVVNYCFEGTISDGQLNFDYKIRKGVSASRNATWLMKKMEIV